MLSVSLSDTVWWWKIAPGTRRGVLVVVRWVLAATSVICILLYRVFISKSLELAPASEPDFNTFLWKKGESGWGEHVVATGAQWTLAICFTLFHTTFSWEFYTLGRLRRSAAREGGRVLQVQESTSSVKAVSRL